MRNGVTNERIAKQWNNVMQSNYGTPEISLVSGKGLEVIDAGGKEYLDLLGGIATNLLGHSHPKIVGAITNQVKKLSHISNFYSHDPGVKLASKLKELTGDSSARVSSAIPGPKQMRRRSNYPGLRGVRELLRPMGRSTVELWERFL